MFLHVLNYLARFSGVLVSVLGAVGLLTRHQAIPSPAEQVLAWPVLTLGDAVAFVVGGVALTVNAWSPGLRPRWHGWMNLGSAAIIVIAGLLELSTSPVSAVALLLLGSALAIATLSQRAVVFQGLVLAAMVIGWLGFCHFVFGGDALFPQTSLSLHAAVGIWILGAGLLCLRSDIGLVSLVIADHDGGAQARLLLPFVIAVPPVLGWLRSHGQSAGWFSDANGITFAASLTVMIFAGLVFITTASLARSNRRRQIAESELALAQKVARIGHVVITFHQDAGRREQRTWSDETWRLLGLDPRSLKPSREAFLSAIHPDDRQILDQAYAAILTGGSPPTFDCRVILPDGGHRIIHGIFAVERDRSGKPQRVITTIQDVTDHRMAELRLREQMARLDLLRRTTHAIGERLDLQSIMQVVVGSLEVNLPIEFVCCCRHDAGAKTLTVTNIANRSAALAKAMAIEVDGAIPIDADDLSRCLAGHLVHEPDVAQIPLAFSRLLAQAGLRSLVMVPIIVDGVVVFVLIAAQSRPGSFSSPDCEFLRQLGEQLALAVHQARLYGDLQRAYEEQKNNQQALIQLERLRVLGQMASGIAHDINNAISPAMLYTEWLLMQAQGLDPDARQQLTTVKRAIEDVAHTVGRLREFYRRDDNDADLVAIDLNEKIQHVIDLTQACWSDLPQQRGVSITVRTELQPDLPSINAVASEVREALINFVFNAVDAMPDGGTLTLRTRTDGNRVVVEVADTGIGMSNDVRQRCLEPFFTTKGERGTGIGLAMVHGIAQRHGAEIIIDSVVGRGTTMGLAFPRGNLRASGIQAAITVPIPARLRILVIDDDPRLLATLSDLLTRDGHEVTQAEGGQCGIDAFTGATAAGRPFAVVITDLGMPHVDGRVVATTVKTTAPSTPVILLTGWGQRLVAGGSAAPQVDRILDKPPTVLALRQALSHFFPPAGG
jgi:signal transduction histidine kinase/PAS domain-containing protein/ActR/RegA family two-component response regulator